jgi:hypothetical protein
MLHAICFKCICVGHGRMETAAYATRVPSHDAAVEVSHLHPSDLVRGLRNAKCSVVVAFAFVCSHLLCGWTGGKPG